MLCSYEVVIRNNLWYDEGVRNNFKKILTLIIALIIAASPALALAKIDCCAEKKSCCEKMEVKDICDSKCSANNVGYNVSDKIITVNTFVIQSFKIAFTENSLEKSLSYGIFNPPKFIS